MSEVNKNLGYQLIHNPAKLRGQGERYYKNALQKPYIGKNSHRVWSTGMEKESHNKAYCEPWTNVRQTKVRPPIFFLFFTIFYRFWKLDLIFSLDLQAVLLIMILIQEFHFCRKVVPRSIKKGSPVQKCKQTKKLSTTSMCITNTFSANQMFTMFTQFWFHQSIGPASLV